MQSKGVQPKGEYLELLKAKNSTAATRAITENTIVKTSKKRKENPIELKYEGSSDKPVPDEEAELPELDKDNRKNFDYIYGKIKEMRKHMNAAVDNYGCQITGNDVITKEDKDFQTLCSLFLSVQNRDESTGKAMDRLRKFGLTIDVAYKMDEEVLLEMIKEVNFKRTKAKNIKAAAKLVVEEYGGKVPDNLDKLLEFPGVGYKIGILYLNTCHNMNVGIGVDTHVHRISNRLAWVKTDKPNDTRVALEKFVPKELWSDINHWLVGFGQQICLPKNPKCEICLLNNVCPEGKRNMRYHKKGRSEKDTKAVEDVEVKVTKKVKKTSPSPKVKKGEGEEKKIMYVKPQRQSKPKVTGEEEKIATTKKKVSNTRRNKSGSR